MLGYGPNQTMVDYGNLLLKASGKPRSSIYADPMLAQVGRHSCKRGLAASLPACRKASHRPLEPHPCSNADCAM